MWIHNLVFPVVGGTMIGLAASLLLFTHGRVAGISGLLASVVEPSADRPEPNTAPDDLSHRSTAIWFITGLLLSGLVAHFMYPSAIGKPVGSIASIGIAGLLVGYGTRVAKGCTSGHGVCGLSRLSVRSLVATVTFIAAGVLTTLAMRHFVGFGGAS